MSRFRKATRSKLRLRMAIDGPSGSGKTYTALECAFALAASMAGPDGNAPRVAVIDSESGSASKYCGLVGPSGLLWDFDVCELKTFSPSEYAAAIEDAARAGYGVVVIDSLSHAWEGKDGALDLKDRAGPNSWAAWKDVTPIHRRMVDAILNSPCHVIATMRSKTEWVTEMTAEGKTAPKRVGTAPVQRAGMEYEFDIYVSLDPSHILTVQKSRCQAVDRAIVARPSASFMTPIIEWLSEGQPATVAAPPAAAADKQLQRIAELLQALGTKLDAEKKQLPKLYSVKEFGELNADQAAEYVQRLERRLATKAPAASSAPAPAPAPQPAPQPAAAPNGTDQAAELDAPTLELIGHAYGELVELDDMTPERWRAEYLSQFGVDRAKALSAKNANRLLFVLHCRIDEIKLRHATLAQSTPFPTTPAQPGEQQQQSQFQQQSQKGDSQAPATPGDGAETLQAAMQAEYADTQRQRAAEQERRESEAAWPS